MAEQKDNSVVIFKNEKNTQPNQPEYRGTIVVDGKEKQISLWVKESSKDGKKYFSGSISEPYKKTESKPVSVKVENEPPF